MSRNDMVKTMQTQAEEIQKLKQLLEQKTEKYTPMCRWKTLQTVQDEQPEFLYPNHKAHFITQTFDQKYYLPQNIDQQIKYFQNKIDTVQSDYQLDYIVYCLEHHKDGTVHAHMIVVHDNVNDICEFEYDLRSYFTNKPKYLNRVNQKVDDIKETLDDWKRLKDYMSKNPILIKKYLKI